MAKIYTPADKLSDVMDFLDANANPCQEAKDYCRSLGDITMGELMNIIEDNPAFEPSWIAYSVVFFPKLMNAVLMAGFETEMNKNPKVIDMVTRSKARKGSKVELEDNV